jgi:lysozyme
MDPQKLRKMIAVDEGIRLKPYRCTAGKLTIGYGHNLDDLGISKDIADKILDEDIKEAATTCLQVFGQQFTGWSENRRLGWLNLAFNLGFVRFFQFKNTIAAAKQGDWDKVEQGLRDSKWFSQVRSRAERVIMLICKEEIPYG